jgi:hypothetical protein
MKNDAAPALYVQTNPVTGDLIAVLPGPSTRPLSRIMRNAVADRLRGARIDVDVATVERCERLLANS